MSAKLATGIWVSAYRMRLEALGIPCVVMRRGDDRAGAVLVNMATLDGRGTLYQRSFDLMSGERAWVALAEGMEAECDAAARRQAAFDPDLWILAVEDRQGRHLLDEPGLAEGLG